MKANKFKKGRKRMNIFTIGKDILVPIFIFASAIIVSAIIYSYPMNSLFPVKHIRFIGNRHLTDDELKALVDVHMNENLVLISSSKVSQQMLRSPWVRTVSLRREFPDALSMTIREAEPFALLDMHDHLYLIAENGKILEELKDGSIPFLPIIAGDPYKEKAGFSEALKLVKLMNGQGLSSDRDHIEIIAYKPEELSVSIDSTHFKIGVGSYEEKLERLIQIEEDIKEMGLLVDYIDLRFEKKAIVKPVTEKVIK